MTHNIDLLKVSEMNHNIDLVKVSKNSSHLRSCHPSKKPSIQEAAIQEAAI